MRRNICVVIFIGIIMSVFSASKSPTDPWKEIDALMEKPALTSAGQKLKELRKKVDKNGTDADRVRALIYQLGIDMGCEYALPKEDSRRRIPNNKSEEAIEVIMGVYKEAEALRGEIKDSVAKSILAYMEAELLSEFSNLKELRWAARSEVSADEVRSEDITEWSYAEVNRKIVELLRGANENIEGMAKVRCEEYGGLFKETGDKKVHWSVADFVVDGSISLLPEENNNAKPIPLGMERNCFFRPYNSIESEKNVGIAHEWLMRLVEAHRKNGATASMIYADVERLKYEYDYIHGIRNESNRWRAEAYMKALDALITAHSEDSAVVYAIAKKVDVMMDELRYKCKSEEFDQENPKKVLDLCESTLRKFGDVYGSGTLRRTVATIKRHELDYSIERDIVMKGEKSALVVRNANVREAVLNIYKVMRSAEELREQPNARLDIHLKKIESRKITLTASNYYIQAMDTIELPSGLDYGKYALEVSDPEAKNQKRRDYVYFDITDLDIVKADGTGDEVPVVVVDRKSGKAIGGARVMKYEYKYGSQGCALTGEKKSGEDGLARMDMKERGRRNLRIYAEKDADKYMRASNAYMWNKPSDNKDTRGNIYTDRGIYRPGQKVRYKVVLYSCDAKADAVVANKRCVVKLMDANWQDVASVKVETNKYGAFDGEFEIPTDALLGLYTINVSTEAEGWHIQNESISVEEYKRPTFEVSYEKVEKAEFWKEVALKGDVKRLSGEAVANAKVKVEIVKHDLFGWRRGFGGTTAVDMQEVETDGDGKFVVRFVPSRNENAKENENDVERFEITATVTEEGGETQSGKTWFTVADRDVRISVRGEELIERREAMAKGKTVAIEVNNVNGMAKEAEVVVEVRKAKTGDVVSKETVKANGKMEYRLPIEKMKAGEYVVEVSEQSNDAKREKDEWKFVVYDKESGEMPTSDLLWANTKRIEVSEGEKAEIVVGSAAQEAHILMMVFVNNRWIEKETKWIDANNSTKKVMIDTDAIFEKGNRAEGANVYLTTIKNGERSSITISVAKKKEDKSLKVSLETFRDKVTPGAKEKWTVKVEGMKEKAEVMCGMYDMSLDAYGSINEWYNPRRYVYHLYGGELSSVEARRRGGMYSQPNEPMNIEAAGPSQSKGLWKEAIGRYNTGRMVMYSMAMPRASAKCMRAAKLGMEDDAVEEEAMFEMSDRDMGAVGMVNGSAGVADVEIGSGEENTAKKFGGEETGDFGNIELRSNFAESVFFYPKMETDNDGRVTFEFEMPHSLTRWKFRAFAHTEDLRSGVMQKEIVSQQPFAVRPNMPRFMRVGDEAHIGVTVINFSAEEKKADVNIVWKNAETGKEIKTGTKKADLTKKRTTVDFGIKVPEGVAAIEVTITARSGTFADGERHSLAVLPNGMRVCKSVNVFAKRGETKKATLPEIEKEATDIRYTMEYSANAAWNAVMALHSVKNTSENAIDMAIALYTDAILGNIAQTYPSIRVAVQKWQETEEGKERSVSPLEQNAELKNLLLKETPWVMEAKTETQWRQEICNALDTKRTAKSCNDIVRAMEKLQNEDGGFAWFPGMQSSDYTTTIVCRYMARLEKRGLLNQVSGAEKMLGKAVKYLDASIVKDYEEQKRYTKKVEPGDWELEVMAVRLMTKGRHSMGIKARGIYDEYRDYALKNWKDFTLYGKSMLVVILWSDGKTSDAKRIAEAMSESATRSAENGMYWKENLDNFRWNGNAVTKHALAMTALGMARANAEEQDEMAIWLVQRKRTTMWENPIEAADAAEAIMTSAKGGANAIANPHKTTVKWGGKQFDTSDENAGEQYIKATAENIVANADAYKEMSVAQSDNSMGYGVVYASYYCPYDAIKSAKSGVRVNKKTYLCVAENDGGKQKEVMKEVKDGAKLKIGDKLKVVLTLKNEQDLDFVCLKDMRAACQEPTISLSGREVIDNLYLYRSTTDTGVRYFFDHLPKGTWVMEYTVYVSAHGVYTAGAATVQSVYAPSFQGNSGNGVKVVVE